MSSKKVHKGPRQFIREYGTDYLFAAPFFILFILFTLLPIAASAVLSFTDFNAVSIQRFVGIRNYLNLILDDGLFLQALKNTFFLSVVTGPAGYFLCLLVAWLLNELGDRMRSFITLLFYAPVISGGAYTVWQIIYSGDAYGFLNGVLLKLSFIDAPIQWLTDTSYMMPAAIVLILWMSFGTGFLSLIAGFKNVDKTLYEAGEVDGVRNRFQELWYITLPYEAAAYVFRDHEHNRRFRNRRCDNCRFRFSDKRLCFAYPCSSYAGLRQHPI